MVPHLFAYIQHQTVVSMVGPKARGETLRKIEAALGTNAGKEWLGRMGPIHQEEVLANKRRTQPGNTPRSGGRMVK